MKRFILILIASLLLVGCGNVNIRPTKTSTLIPTSTQIPSSTQTFTPKPTSTPRPTATATPMPLPANITLEVGEGVTPADIAEISEALGIIHSYIQNTFGTDPVLDQPFSAKIIAVGKDNQEPGDLKGQCCGHMSGEKPRLFFDVLHPIWLQGDIHIPGNPVTAHLHNVAHEYIHDWQEAQGCFSTPGHPDPTPMRGWISEGMAEYLSAAGLVAAGKLTWEEAHASWQLADAKGAPYTKFPSLKTMEFDFQGWDYSFAFLAIERLVDRSSNGVLSLRVMCLDSAKGMSYSKAFQDAFGLSVTSFYADFPAYAQNELGIGFSEPTPTPTGTVRIKGKVTLSAGTLRFDQYVISFCNVKIPQCLPGTLINADGTFFSYLVPGEYLISVNPINGGEALGWYSSKGLVQETTCTEKVQIDKNQEITITIDPSDIRPCS
jgi:hypothetical protein